MTGALTSGLMSPAHSKGRGPLAEVRCVVGTISSARASDSRANLGRIAMSHISGRAGWWKPPSPVLVRASGEQSPGATRQDPAVGGAVWPALLVTLRRSHTTGRKSKAHPTYTTKYRVANWPAYKRGPRSPRRCDGVGVLGSDHCLDAPPKRPAGWAAAVLGSRHRDRSDPATPLPSPAAPGRRVPSRPVRCFRHQVLVKRA